MDTVQLIFGRALFETSTCTQQVTALSSGESEFYGVLRGSACALQVRHVLLDMNTEMEVEILTDSSAARGMLRLSRSGRVKHLEARWLWVQERTRAKEPLVGTVDAALNSTDLGTKFHLRRRFEELQMMLPLRIGVWLISSYGAEGLSMDRADSENRDVSFIDKLSLSTWWIFRGMEISIGLLLGKHCANPPTNTQPTSPTNIQHGGPPSSGPHNISLILLPIPIHFSLFESTRKVHFATLMDIRHIQKSECIPENVRKCNLKSGIILVLHEFIYRQ